MTAAVETMAYANEVPWHGLGNKVTNKMSPEEMAKAAGITWTVSKRPMQFLGADQKTWMPSKEDFALVRDSDDRQLSTVGQTWKPVQNLEALDFFTKFAKAGHMTMETAGSLWNGRYIWGLARIGKDFSLGGKTSDEVRGYLLLASPHVRGKAMLMQFTAIRVVCWNTFCMAIGSNMKGDGTGFRVPHSMKFDDACKAQAETALGLTTKQMDEFKDAATLLSKKKMKPDQVEEFFCEVLRFDPKEAKKNEEREPQKLSKFRAALVHAPGQQLPTALGTVWGAFNAVTYVIDHETGRERETALKNAWLGNTANIKRRAFELAVKAAA